MFDVRTYGAIGDGKTDDSAAIKAALADCKKAGGGTVNFPAGTYLSGPIALSSNMTLNAESGAVVKFLPDFNLYEPVLTRWEGVECYGLHPLIFASDSENVSVTGRGIFDGQGQFWWDALRARRKAGKTKPETAQELALAKLNPSYEMQPGGGGGREMQFLRPPLLQMIRCKNVLIEGITIQNSPFWNAHPVYCDNITFHGVTIKNPADSPNTDGLDVDSCTNVKISDCTFDVGDDCLVLKSGAGPDGVRVNKPTENVMITNCLMYAGHGGVVIGSETAGGIRNVTVSNCVFWGTDRGIRIKTRRSRGGAIENLMFSNIIMEKVLCPIVVNMYYRCGALAHEDQLFSLEPQKIIDTTPLIRGISISHLTVRGASASAGIIAGLPERPIEDLIIADCVIDVIPDSTISPDESAMSRGLPAAKGRGIRIINAKGGSIKNVKINLPANEALVIEQGSEVSVS